MDRGVQPVRSRRSNSRPQRYASYSHDANLLCGIPRACSYRRPEDNAVATASALLLMLAYFGALTIKTFEDFTDAVTDPDLVARVLGYSSTDSIVNMLLAASLVMLLVIIASAIQSLRSQHLSMLLLKETRLPPQLSLAPGKRWMLFISHIWSTGQDQVRMYLLQSSCKHRGPQPLYIACRQQQ